VQLFALPGFLAFFFVSLWVGVRLLAQWGRTRQLPELLLGIGVLCIGPIGFGLVMLATAAGAAAPEAPSLFGGLSAVAVGSGASAKAVFNWKIYHPGSRFAALVAFAAIALLALAITGDALTTGFAPASWMQPGWMLVRQVVQIAVLLWGAVEALLWWRRMVRRLGIGLGDPIVANRFLLWAVGAGMAGTGSLVGMVVGLAYGRPMNELPALTLVLSLFGMASAVSLWLAFATPEWFKRRVLARAQAQNAST
jgi:hypothetical protein